MNRSEYRRLSVYAGSGLLRPHPWPVPATVPFPLRFEAAVYVAVDAEDVCRYVGSVSRPDGGLAARIAEHLDDPVKRQRWRQVWVLPLRPELTRSEVRRIEGVVGAHLGPTDSVRLPTPYPPIRVGESVLSSGPIRSASRAISRSRDATGNDHDPTI